MSRTPAHFTQADIARVIRAAKQTGATMVEIRPDGVMVVHFSPSEKEKTSKDDSFNLPNSNSCEELMEYYEKIGFDPNTMDSSDFARIREEMEEKWRASIPGTPLGKREKNALFQLLELGVGKLVEPRNIKGIGPDTEERLEARGYIEVIYYNQQPDRLEGYILTDAGLAAAQTLLSGNQ